MGFELSPTTSGDASPPPPVQAPKPGGLHYLFPLHPCRRPKQPTWGLLFTPSFHLFSCCIYSPLLTINYFFLLRKFRLGCHWGKGDIQPPWETLRCRRAEEGSGWEARAGPGQGFGGWRTGADLVLVRGTPHPFTLPPPPALEMGSETPLIFCAPLTHLVSL